MKGSPGFKVGRSSGADTAAYLYLNADETCQLAFADSGANKGSFYADYVRKQFLISTSTQLGNQYIFTSHDNVLKDHDHAPTPPGDHPIVFIQSQKNPDVDNSQWMSLKHDGSGSFITSATGDVIITGSRSHPSRPPAKLIVSGSDKHVALWYADTTAYLTASTGNILLIPGTDAAVHIGTGISGDNTRSLYVRGSTVSTIGFRKNNSFASQFYGSYSNSQLALELGANLGRQLVLCNGDAAQGRDYDHATPTNPTLYVHSANDPNEDNTEYVSVHRTGPQAVLTVGGTGSLVITGSGRGGGGGHGHLMNVGIGDTDPKTTLSVVHDYNETTFENQLSDGEGGGEILRYSPGANDTLTVGQLYFLHTDGTWDQTDADAVATGAKQLLGIGLGNARTAGVLIKGFVRIPSTEILNTPALGAVDGLPVYVSTTAGHIDFTAPSLSSDFVRIIGYAIDDDSSDVLIYFDPDGSWVEID